MKKLVVFDLDGTLAESKSSLDAEMATLLSTLLGMVEVAVISGGNWQQFKEQLLANLPHDERLKHLSLLGGTTSVDITKLGIDKAYGIRKLRDTLGIAIEEMIFIGDALFPGGNDYPAKEAGVLSIQVRDPNESKRVIEAIIACLDGDQPATSPEETCP